MKPTDPTSPKPWWPVLVITALTACGPAEGVVVQELPALGRPSIEARAGLAEVRGGWNLTGWVASSAATADAIPSQTFRSLVVQEQRVDSLSGFLARLETSRPFVGEIRRDGIVALFIPLDGVENVGGVLAGVVERDTLWLELSTLPELPIPPGVRAAYVRASVGQTWIRSPAGALLRDTVEALPTAPDTLHTQPEPVRTATPTPASPRPAPETTPRPRDTAPRELPSARPLEPESIPRPTDATPTSPEPTAPDPDPLPVDPDRQPNRS